MCFYFSSLFPFLRICLFYGFYSFLLGMTHIVLFGFLHLICVLVLTHHGLGFLVFGLNVECLFRNIVILCFLLSLVCQSTFKCSI